MHKQCSHEERKQVPVCSECRKLIDGLRAKGQGLQAKIAESRSAIETYDQEIKGVEGEFSEVLVTRMWQMHRICEIKVRIAKRESQIARYQALLAGNDCELTEALKTLRGCTPDEYSSLFAGGGSRTLSGSVLILSGLTPGHVQA